jgi:hypothetical protein
MLFEGLGFEFGYVCDIEPVRALDGSIQTFMPQSQYKNVRNLPISSNGAGPFCKFKIPNSFRVSGVYIISVDDEIRYVGECINFSKRFNAGYGNICPRNCFKGGQGTNCRLNNLVYSATVAGSRISLWFFQTPGYKAVEVSLRSTLRPIWNRV